MKKLDVGKILTINDWDWLSKLPIFQALKSCQQELDYHGEGDVFTHVNMILGEMIKLDDWKTLSDIDRSKLFLSVIFHDIGKPATTKLDEETGKLTSKKHAIVGEIMSRNFLTENKISDFKFIYEVSKLVKYHSRPIWLFEGKDPFKDLIKLSLLVDTNLLYLLARVDAMGRIASDKGDLLYQIDLFKEYCIDKGVLSKPYPFENDHSRFVYFNRGKDYPHNIFDDTKFTIHLVCGMPGTGKDTFIGKNLPELPVISLDNIREEYKVNPNKEKLQGFVVQMAKDKLREYCRKGQDCIWNATLSKKMYRQQIIDIVDVYHGKINIIYIHNSIDKILKQNAERSRQVPDDVIIDYYNTFELPDITEAHSVNYIH